MNRKWILRWRILQSVTRPDDPDCETKERVFTSYAAAQVALGRVIEGPPLDWVTLTEQEV